MRLFNIFLSFNLMQFCYILFLSVSTSVLDEHSAVNVCLEV